MAISPVTNTPVPPTPTQVRSTERVEGNRPDNDRDSDDKNQRASITANNNVNTSQTTESLGNNIDVSA